MNKDLWDFYMDNLQGHPGRCVTPDALSVDVMSDQISKYFTDKNGRVLVVGCADGREVHLLNELGYRLVMGVTLGKLNVAAAQKDYPKAIVLNQDMHDFTTFPVEVFDYVYSNQTFEHSFAPFLFCLELWAVMKPGGLAYISYPSHCEEGRSGLTDPMTAIMSHHHPNMLRPNDTELLFKLTGFSVLDKNLNGGNDVFVMKKLPIDELIEKGVHSDVVNTLMKRLQIRR